MLVALPRWESFTSEKLMPHPKILIPLITITIVVLLTCYGCQRKPVIIPEVDKVIDKGPELQPIGETDTADFLYYVCDSIVRRNDSVLIYNSRFDTIIIDTGIYSYLHYDYERVAFSSGMADAAKTASRYQKHGPPSKASEAFRKVIDYYTYDRPAELEKFSDGGQYYGYQVNSSVLCSYAYEQLGLLDSAIIVLKPFLHVEGSNYTKINQRYAELIKMRSLK
jgi:hypothetical protein